MLEKPLASHSLAVSFCPLNGKALVYEINYASLSVSSEILNTKKLTDVRGHTVSNFIPPKNCTPKHFFRSLPGIRYLDETFSIMFDIHVYYVKRVDYMYMLYFPLYLCMVIHDNEYKTKTNKN